MPTNNQVGISSSGIVSYDGAGTFSGLANPLTVPNGGSGITSNTVYAVLCGGTTSTGNIQSIASVGTSAQVLTSNGAGALPTFQAAPSTFTGYVICCQTDAGNPADGTTAFFRNGAAINTTSTAGNAETRFLIPVTGTISKCYGTITVQGTLATTETATLSIRLNNTTDTTVTSALQFNTTNNTFNNTGLAISVTAGDYIQFKLVNPTWATNPTTVRASISILIT